MIRLHLLGFTPDLKGLVFSGRRGGRTGTYWVPVDDEFWKSLQQLEGTRAERAVAEPKPKGRRRKLTADELTLVEVRELLAGRRGSPAAAEQPPAAPEPESEPEPEKAPKQESRLSLREVQSLLREGRSVKDVADLAGVDEAWVERFTGPVMHEVRGVVAMTRAAYQQRARLGPSGLPVGDAVVRNLQDRKATQQTLEGIDEGWDARRTRTGLWRVRLRFTHRGKRRAAEWDFSKETREVHPRNDLARELGWWPSPETRAAKAVRSSSESEDEGGTPTRKRPSRKAKPAARKRKPAAARKAAPRKGAKRRSGR
ncbi:MAG TPA: septation protein SepH [Actinomycetota bacterium]|nr:septation protein SepH [Actinomycetota bacterium]